MVLKAPFLIVCLLSCGVHSLALFLPSGVTLVIADLLVHVPMPGHSLHHQLLSMSPWCLANAAGKTQYGLAELETVNGKLRTVLVYFYCGLSS